MKLSEAIEKLNWLSEQISPSPIKEAIDTVVSEIEKPSYTAQDMEAFLLWASDNGWFYGKLTEMWHNYAKIDINADYDTSKRYSIDDLVKIWEQQRKEATE